MHLRIILITITLFFTFALARDKPPPRYEPVNVELGRKLSYHASIILPSSPLWPVATQRWTTWSWPEVHASVEAATIEDVQATVEYAYLYHIPILVRTSGHGFTKTLDESLRAGQNGIQLSLKKLDSIAIDPVANTMTVGGGVKSGQVADALAKAGKRAAIASVDCISYLGAGLGGGHGRYEGLHGLIADNLLEAKVVIANGSLVVANETENPDLFWALRGAGHNYGVTVSATFRIHDPVDQATWIIADYFYDPSQIPALISHINRFRSIQPDTLTLTLSFLSDPTNPDSPSAPPLVKVSLQYGGPADDFPSLVRPFMDEFKPYRSVNATVPWNRMNEYTGGGIDGDQCAAGKRRAWFSEMLVKYVSDDIVASYEYLKSVREPYPQLARSGMRWESYPLKGVKAVKAEETAYPWREMNVMSVFIVETTTLSSTTLSGPTTPDDALMKHVGEAGRRILKQSFPNDGPEKVYVNYAYGDEGARSMYWGQETWRMHRLQREKMKWDEYAVFSRYNPVWP